QTNFYIAFQSVAMFGGLISEELWTGAVRLQTNRLSARNFAGTDDINADFFAPLSLAVASNENAVSVLAKGANASTDLNLATAAGPGGAAIVNASNVGLARAYLQMGDYANAASTAALVPPDFVVNVVTTANPSTVGILANTYVFNGLEGQIVAPKLYRIGDPRMPIDSTTPGATLNQLPYVVQAKY